ncbi:uncharacterized protein LOC124132449 [Haliotis rufescens]|uniref:uncharacterized protein LOC124132449 n=1 Tax=Haliotis rufescens TaxID=6454 RepID=UPI00201EF499|nr:uncharacterized protein LOC124132449 [Haliotis rufescens]
MPRIYYIPPDDFEPLPEWMEGSSLGKSRKVGGGDGESERLMKKGREQKTRGSRKEMERMRRYEESMKRKEKMVKEDSKRSTMADSPDKRQMSLREVGKNGQKASKNDKVVRDAGKRWQLGDGFKVALQKDAVSTGTSKSGRKNLSRRHRDARKEDAVVEVGRVRGKEKGKEWMAKVHTANLMATSVQVVSSESFRNHTDRNVDVFDIVSPWPISRYCMEDSYYKLNAQAHCYNSDPSDSRDLGEQPVNFLYSLFGRPAPDTGDVKEHSDEQMTPGVKCQKSESLRKRFSSALHRLAGFLYRSR